MELLYVQEHLSCYHYDKSEDPTVKYTKFAAEDKENFMSNKNVVFFVLEGSISVSFGKIVNRVVNAGDIFLLPAYMEITGVAKTKARVFLFNLPVTFSFCDHFSLEMLYQESKELQKEQASTHILKTNERIDAYLDSFLPCWEDGLRCNFFLELKIKEFFFLLRAYTPREDLIAFFMPILSDDMEFYNLILNKSQSVKTAKELARLANYSLTGFEKKFKKIFGTSAHKWMKKQLAANIYHEIRCTTKTFMEISDAFGFSSSAHFSNFCKAVFGLTPKAIRKGETKELSNEEE
jgi:AraC-like DNA-binding protein